MRVGVGDPCWAEAKCGARGQIFRASSALPSSEAQSELLSWAGLRAISGRAGQGRRRTTHTTKQKKGVGGDFLRTAGLPNTPFIFPDRTSKTAMCTTVAPLADILSRPPVPSLPCSPRRTLVSAADEPSDNPQEQGITVTQFDKYLSVEPTMS